jgi:hypothetical protein
MTSLLLGCIAGMLFVNNFLIWIRFYRLKTQLDQLYFKKWEHIINDNPGESASDLAYLKERGFLK